ncbi:unnamed protein product [Cuscuta campestris]|uniref:Bromodomain associated domain-containing protein n=1 Tax=Cuscuta campestris TaxID=132261 RepID=A0A484NKM7_9ASTE|nr:unnamed protein product [Cuscuta campestris]
MKSGDNSSTAAPPQSRSSYASSVTRIAVAQICGAAGYAAAESSAIAVLTDIAALYLNAIGKSAASSANSSGRTDSNLLDVAAALEELGSVQGFPGASDPPSSSKSTLLNSAVIGGLQKFVNYTEETPFARPLPRNVLHRRKTKLPLKRGAGEYDSEKLRHVPKWLPSMPEIERDAKGEEKLGFGRRIESESENQEGKGKNSPERGGKGNELPWNRRRIRFKVRKRGESIRECSHGVGRGAMGKRVSWANLNLNLSGKSLISTKKFELDRPNSMVML